MVITEVLVIILALVIGIPFGIFALIYLIVPTCKGVAWCFRQVARFIGAEIVDALRLVGSIITGLVFIPLTLVNVLFGRWSSATHFGRALEAEGTAILGCIYRIFVGHPARLLCLSPLTEGLERRVPQAMAMAPGADAPRGRINQFDGYTIIGSLPGGGSGSRLYIAEPTAEKVSALVRAGRGAVDRVVIKSFSLSEGSTLPQIVRENRALSAASRMGLILEHELTDDRFFYVTRYVPGEALGIVTQRLHASGDAAGLSAADLALVTRFARDIAQTLADYHAGGLWHKDVKPDNIIVSGNRAHLVDFGLVTPLRSTVTLTTHGTEYFRDPEMVRLALRGVKVHEVDGARFDIYALGAVLYSMIENSFPAHGGLSQISRRCPEALRWIVRRAMTDYDKRYRSALELLRDLDTVLSAGDPFALKPVDLPSMRSGADSEPFVSAPAPVAFQVDGVSAGAPRPHVPPVSPPPFAARASTAEPRLRVTDWWTGKYRVEPGGGVAAPPPPLGAEVAEQIAHARAHARRAQDMARQRLDKYRADPHSRPNRGVIIAVLSVFALGAAAVAHNWWEDTRARERAQSSESAARPQPDGLPVVVAGATQPTDARATSARTASSRRSTSARQPAPSGPRPPNANILLLSDSLVLSSADQARADRQTARLVEAGFQLRGALAADAGSTANPASPAETETELLASLKSRIAVAPFGSPEAADAIKEWLADHPAFDLVLWIGRDERAQASAWLVPAARADPKVVTAARAALEEPATREARSKP